MEEIKKEETAKVEEVKEVKKEISLEDIENLINKKTVELFGNLLIEINKPKEEKVEKEEPPKEKTLEDYYF